MQSQYHFPRRTFPRGSCLGSPVFLQRQLCVYTPQPIKYAFSLLSMPFTDFFSTLKQTEVPMAQFNFASPTFSVHPPLNYPECPGGWQVRHPSPVEVSPYTSHCITLSNFLKYYFLYLCPVKLLLNQTLSCFGVIFFFLFCREFRALASHPSVQEVCFYTWFIDFAPGTVYRAAPPLMAFFFLSFFFRFRLLSPSRCL